jgi:hypothetical protein
MKTLSYSITINKPRDFVFSKIMDKSVYPVTCSPFSVPIVEGKSHAVLDINSYGDSPFKPL